MNSKEKHQKKAVQGSKSPTPRGSSHGRIVSMGDGNEYLDTTQLNRLEQSFREWAEGSPRADVRFSRQRILLIFLFIRYTGAKLNEVLSLNPLEDIDPIRNTVVFRGNDPGPERETREIHISKALSREIRDRIADPAFQEKTGGVFTVDPGFVRRKFYERARACGFAERRGGPEAIRKARAVEWMQSDMPLPAVQMILGHSTPNLTSSYVSFSKEEIQLLAKRFMEKESMRKSSARNRFFCKIENILRGDIQTRVEMTTIDGHSISTVITNDSLERLDLHPNRLITAEVKAPWVLLQGGGAIPVCSAENRLQGVLTQITEGEINTEYVVRVSNATEVCAVVSSAACRDLELNPGDTVWVLFNCFSVVLHLD